MRLQIQPAAAQEILVQHAWYLERDLEVADRLATLFEDTVVEIVRHPLQFSLMEMEDNPGNVRRARLKGFPLFVLYQLWDDEIEIIGVPHTSRDQNSWRSRLRRP
jgi:plasmid stabilization system protein ParE